MPSKIILDTISTTTDSGDISTSENLILDLSDLDHIQLPVLIGSEDLTYDGLYWESTQKKLIYKYSEEDVFDIVIEEDYDRIPRTGSILHLDVYDTFSYTSGNLWYNMSKHVSNTLSNVNGVFFDDVERAFYFNALDSHFLIDQYFTTTAMKQGTGSSYSFWFKADPNANYGTSAGDKILFSVNQDVDGTISSPILKIGINPNGGIYYDDDVVSSTTIGSTNYNDNQWHNLVVTRSEGTGGQISTFYIDGVSIGTLSGTNPSYNNGSIVILGAATDPSDLTNQISIFGGFMSAVFIYERELLSSEVLNTFNELSYRYGL